MFLKFNQSANANTFPNNSWRRRATSVNETETAASDRTQRLGNLGLTTGYGNSLGGYGSYGGVGTYGKPSIDIGGVVLVIRAVIINLGYPKKISFFLNTGNTYWNRRFAYTAKDC